MKSLISKSSTEKWDPALPLTMEGGPFDRGPGLRSIAAFYSDGRMLVSKSHLNNPEILSLAAEAEMEGYPAAQVEPVDISVITQCYMAAASTVMSVRDDARMRREVVDLVGKLAKRRASDIHIVVGEGSTQVRARIDGLMEHVSEWPPEYGHSFCAAAFAMADASDVNYQPYEYQAARVSNRNDLRLPEGVISLRLQFNPTTYGGRALIIRLLYSASEKDSGDISQLGFSPEQIEDFEYLRAKPYGINIVAGPTGHGKSTTLTRNIQAILQENNFNIAVFTVEDPPEYPIPGAVQMPVVNASSTEERSEAFTKAIAASLRSNPDRIMIGEIRDGASAKLAFEAAMTGHQVWTTLHSNDAITIPFRMRDLSVEDYKLTDPTLLTGMISQRLVRKLCKNCCRPVIDGDEIPYGLMGRLDEAGVTVESMRLRNPLGCEVCGKGNGYAGRGVVAEIILPDEGFMEWVRKNNKAEAENYWLSQLGGRNMTEHMLDRVSIGDVDPNDAEKIVGQLVRPKRV